MEGEAYCERLFQLERTYVSLTPEQRKQKRQELSKPVLEEFLAWGSTRTAAKNSKLGIALTYLHNNGKELSEYLNDGRLEISNNLAERSIKPFVIDRKKSYEKMVEYAEKLSKPFPHVRVDFYNIDGTIIFGELTFFTNSGYIPFDPDSFDFEMGKAFVLPKRNH